MKDASTIEELRAKIASIESTAPSSLHADKATPERESVDAFRKIVDLVNVSDRSEKALWERLARDGYSNVEIDDAVSRAIRCGIIDDARYAEVLVMSRLRQGKGSAGIERELREQGIDADSIPGWPYDFGIDEESEYQRALQFIESHPTRSKNKREGAYRKLVQKGYSSAVASAAARSWSERDS